MKKTGTIKTKGIRRSYRSSMCCISYINRRYRWSISTQQRFNNRYLKQNIKQRFYASDEGRRLELLRRQP
ncbi:MAG: hypothetical protein II589_06975, partial [Clostridia bacterium]|nr:hypothetical protein [Clostridia bacterium]